MDILPKTLIRASVQGTVYLIESASGNVYTYNPELPKMTHAHRTLYMLQRAGVNLSLHEWIAILTQHGTASEENRFYQGCENNLAVILQSAVRIAVMKEEDI